MTTSCLLNTTQLIARLTKESKEFQSGSFSYSAQNPSNHQCTTLFAGGGSLLSAGGQTTVFLYPYEILTVNNFKFKVAALTATSLSMTVTDNKTGKNTFVVFTPGQSKSVLGQSMALKSIKNIITGTENGQTAYSLKAALQY